jgi:hypothetical protein
MRDEFDDREPNDAELLFDYIESIAISTKISAIVLAAILLAILLKG